MSPPSRPSPAGSRRSRRAAEPALGGESWGPIPQRRPGSRSDRYWLAGTVAQLRRETKGPPLTERPPKPCLAWLALPWHVVKTCLAIPSLPCLALWWADDGGLILVSGPDVVAAGADYGRWTLGFRNLAAPSTVMLASAPRLSTITLRPGVITTATFRASVPSSRSQLPRPPLLSHRAFREPCESCARRSPWA